ncbi:uncharacterized protein LOC142289700 [Anomaloglossus baeobatrachus]|uniref:uncharacterized protein LOC142289700 n=1 Tax=Anomaloglossus baeobatrachus TaxID=238106 RepID=UPI003F507C8F
MASPLQDLLVCQMKNWGPQFKWTSQQEESFIQLKMALTGEDILANPDDGQPFILYTDASNLKIREDNPEVPQPTEQEEETVQTVLGAFPKTWTQVNQSILIPVLTFPQIVLPEMAEIQDKPEDPSASETDATSAVEPENLPPASGESVVPLMLKLLQLPAIYSFSNTIIPFTTYNIPISHAGSSPIVCSDSTCGGSCTSSNGCYCSNNIDPCLPDSASLCPMDDNTCCNNLANWYWDGTQKCCTQTPQCNPTCYSDEVCDTHTVACNCNPTTYAGLKPQALNASVKCDGGVMIASISYCKLEEIGYDYNSFHLINNSSDCTFTYNETINNLRERSIQVKAAIGWCGNIAWNDSSKIYFTNTLRIDAFSGPLITKNPIFMNFSCEYNLTMQTSLNFTLNPKISSVVIPSPGAGLGYYTLTMAAYSDPDFTVPIQEGQDIFVGSDLYVGVFSPDLDADAFALRLVNCYATPSKDLSSPSVQLIKGGCADNSDVVTNVIENGNSSEARFHTSAFLFQNYAEVYMYCEVELCNKTNDCTACNTARSGKTGSSGLGLDLTFQDKYTDASSGGHHTVASWTMLAASLFGLLSGKFF